VQYEFRCSRCQDALEVNSFSPPSPDQTVYLDPCSRCHTADVENAELRLEAEGFAAGYHSAMELVSKAIREFDLSNYRNGHSGILEGIKKLEGEARNDALSQGVEKTRGGQCGFDPPA